MTMMCHIGDEDRKGWGSHIISDEDRKDDSDGSMLTHGFKDHDDDLCPKCGSKNVPVEPTCVKNEEVEETHRKIAKIRSCLAKAESEVDRAISLLKNGLERKTEDSKRELKAVQAACKHPNLYKRHSTLDNSDLWTCDDCLGQWINKP
jgi:uncharacterized protein YjcR